MAGEEKEEEEEEEVKEEEAEGVGMWWGLISISSPERSITLKVEGHSPRSARVRVMT